MYKEIFKNIGAHSFQKKCLSPLLIQCMYVCMTSYEKKEVCIEFEKICIDTQTQRRTLAQASTKSRAYASPHVCSCTHYVAVTIISPT